MRDQVDLVGEVVVQDAVRVLGVLRDLAQAGAGVAQLGQGLQGGRGELVAALGELVDLASRDAVTVGAWPVACRPRASWRVSVLQQAVAPL